MPAAEPKDSMGTTAVRYPRDLAEMLSALVWYEGIKVSELLDQLTRPAVESRFAELPKAVRDRVITRLESHASK